MASSILYSNFTAGLVSPKLSGQYNSSAYHNGCSVLENFSIMIQGGLTRRPATGKINTALGSRLIPFAYSTEKTYILELYDLKARVWITDTNNEAGIVFLQTIDFPYTISQIPDVRYTQTYDTLVLVHPQVRPYLVKIAEDGSLTCSYIEPKFTEDDNGLIHDEEDVGLFTTKDFPSETFYYTGRLWFASSNEHPFKLWASRPFKIENFEFKDKSEILDDTQTADAIIEAITSGGDLGDINTTRVGWRYFAREDNAMQLEVGASRNDKIMWIRSMSNNLVVGTAAGEWIMSGSINALSPRISQVSSYGSGNIMPINAGSDAIFIQSGNKRVRAYVGSAEGYGSPDLSLACDNLLAKGIVSMAWRRIPEPTLYCVLSDGALAVMFYDRINGLQAWSNWTFSGGKVKDICTVDTPTGQNTYIIIQRGSSVYLEYFKEVDALDSFDYQYADRDGDVPYTSIMRTNPYERSSNDGSSLGKKKRFYSIVLRVLNSKGFEAGYIDNHFKSYEGECEQDDIEILLPGGFSKRVSMEVRSVADKSLTMLGMALVTEVS